jgi:hypothetical protein
MKERLVPVVGESGKVNSIQTTCAGTFRAYGVAAGRLRTAGNDWMRSSCT